MAQKRADPKKPGSGRPVEGRKSEPAQESTVFSGEVKLKSLKRTSLDAVKLANGPRVVHYRQEGYYIIVLKPAYTVEVEIERGDRVQKRYYTIGHVFTLEPVKEVDEALQTFEKIQAEQDVVGEDELQLVMVPRRAMRKIVEYVKKNPTKSYLIIIQAQGQGRDRTYTVVKIAEATFGVEEPSTETTQELEEALKNIIAKIGKKNGGDSE